MVWGEVVFLFVGLFALRKKSSRGETAKFIRDEHRKPEAKLSSLVTISKAFQHRVRPHVWQWSPLVGRAFTTYPHGPAILLPWTSVRPHIYMQAFSETDREISRVVAIASVIMALLLVVLGCITACTARVVAGGIVKPVNQLNDVVSALNRLDFSRQVQTRDLFSVTVQTHLFVLSCDVGMKSARACPRYFHLFWVRQAEDLKLCSSRFENIVYIGIRPPPKVDVVYVFGSKTNPVHTRVRAGSRGGVSSSGSCEENPALPMAARTAHRARSSRCAPQSST